MLGGSASFRVIAVRRSKGPKMTHQPDTNRMIAASHARTQRTREAALEAIQRLRDEGLPIDFQSVANAADCSRVFLYGQPDIKEAIKAARQSAADSAHAREPISPKPRNKTDSLEKLRRDIAAERQEKVLAKQKAARMKRHFMRYREALLHLLGVLETNVPEGAELRLPKGPGLSDTGQGAVMEAAAVLRYAGLKVTLRRIQALSGLPMDVIVAAAQKSPRLAREHMTEIAMHRALLET